MKLVHTFRTFHPNLGLTDGITAEIIEIDAKDVTSCINGQIDALLDDQDRDELEFSIVRPHEGGRDFGILVDAGLGEEHYWACAKEG